MRDLKKGLFISAGILFTILALVGIFFPVLPTTPFLLLAAYFFGRSSTRALQWLVDNRWFGGYIRNYREGRGMAVQDKVFTLLSLWATIGLSAILLIENTWIRILLIVVAVGVTVHLLRIRTYRPTLPSATIEKTVEPEV